jgi:hypothetical protein
VALVVACLNKEFRVDCICGQFGASYKEKKLATTRTLRNHLEREKREE